MEDRQIVDLYWARNECAIAESDQKYGRMLRSLSYSCLSSREDAEECVNDTYLAAWNAMPTERPDSLGAFLSKIVRRISIDRFRRDHREKRGGMDGVVALTDELAACLPDPGSDPSKALENGQLRDALNTFLGNLPKEKRVMFVQRYFYACPIIRIARAMGMNESAVKVTLHRVRQNLRIYLEKEGLL